MKAEVEKAMNTIRQICDGVQTNWQSHQEIQAALAAVENELVDKHKKG